MEISDLREPSPGFLGERSVTGLLDKSVCINMVALKWHKLLIRKVGGKRSSLLSFWLAYGMDKSIAAYKV
jgi:hypothetical protein